MQAARQSVCEVGREGEGRREEEVPSAQCVGCL